MSTEHPPLPPGWNRPQPEVITGPSLWPAAMALATVALFGGLVTSLIITGAGAVLFAVSLAGWIGEMRNGQKKPDSKS